VSGIRVDEWQAALAALTAKSADGFTTAEMADNTGHTVTWAQTKLREAVRKGFVVYAGTRETTRVDGKPCKVPVYRAVKYDE